MSLLAVWIDCYRPVICRRSSVWRRTVCLGMVSCSILKLQNRVYRGPNSSASLLGESGIICIAGLFYGMVGVRHIGAQLFGCRRGHDQG